MGHRRAPGVEHGDEADAGTEMLWIGRDGEQRLGRRAEQQVVDHRLVLTGDRGNLGRQGEDHVEVVDRQQIGLAGGGPSLAAAPWHLGQCRLRKSCRRSGVELPPGTPPSCGFTSGSGGAPKAVVLTHANLLANRRQIAARVDFSPAIWR